MAPPPSPRGPGSASAREDNVIHRLRGVGYALIEPTRHPEQLAECAAPITSRPEVPGRLDPAGATALLDLSAEPFTFFVDRDSGRGNIMYRRYDGHHGLITPAVT